MQREPAHLSAPRLSLHCPLTLRPFAPHNASRAIPGASRASSPPVLSSPRTHALQAFRLASSLHINQEICRNTQSTCLCCHLCHLCFWLPDCLSLALGLSHWRSTVLTAICGCPLSCPHAPSSFPVVNDGLAKGKKTASDKIKSLSEQLSGVTVSSDPSAWPGVHLCCTPWHRR